MGSIGCDINGNLNEAKFGEPIPWIGLYVAGGSMACALAMAADVLYGFRRKKWWFPSKFFSINATTLTVITVAVKLSVDLNTAMPRRVDQLAKLSSGVLLCTVMGNSMPSLGSMDDNDLVMNVIALGILVITVVVNICIQLSTGVIYLYWREHAVIMFLMLFLLIILSSSALAVPATKACLEVEYKKKYEMAIKEGAHQTDGEPEKKLKEKLMKFWMMAQTSSPQFVVGRSVTCSASGLLSLLGAVVLGEAILRSYLMPWSFKFCSGESDYKWSSILVLISQTAAIGVGTIAPAVRWFTAVNFKHPTRTKSMKKSVFQLERYWFQLLKEMKEIPLAIRIMDRGWRKLAHQARNRLLDFCIGMQTGVVFSSKVLQMISVFCVGKVLQLCDYCRKSKTFRNNSDISFSLGSSGSQQRLEIDLSRFVLHLEGEDQLVELMTKRNRDATDHWIQQGRVHTLKYLEELLEKSTQEFQGVKDFDSNLVLSLDCDEPPNCWSLPVVTLTAIAVALPGISSTSVQLLMAYVHEALVGVKFMEEQLCTEKQYTNIRNAAYTTWLGVDLYQKWLDVDLHQQSLQAKSTREILEGLVDSAKSKFLESKKTSMNQCLMETTSKWPLKVLAANSMYRISKTILQNHETGIYQDSEKLFEALTTRIADIVAACLTNIKRAIFCRCCRSTIEEKEENVRLAGFILGKTEKMRNSLDKKELPNLSPEQMENIDEWRSYYKLKKPAPFCGCSEDSETASPASVYCSILCSISMCYTYCVQCITPDFYKFKIEYPTNHQLSCKTINKIHLHNLLLRSCIDSITQFHSNQNSIST